MIAINLIDAAVLFRRRRRRRVRRWAMVTACVALAGAFPVSIEFSRHRQVQALERERADVEQQIEQIRSELADVGADIRTLESQIARADALRTKRSWSRLLALLSRSLPDEMWLVAVSTDPAAPARSDLDLTDESTRARRTAAKKEKGDGDARVVTMIAPRALAFEGFALRHRALYEFMSRLQQTRAFGDVWLTRASEEPVLDATAVKFNIRCSW